MKNTKNNLARIVAAAAGASALLIAGAAQAALQDRDLDGDSVVDAFYDTEFDITWLRDANVNGLMDWDTAIAWADNFSFAGYDDWRLPATLMPDPGCSTQLHNLTYGYNCTGSEMGHLWYVELGNLAGGPITNNGNFQRLEVSTYWSGTEYVGHDSAWRFNANSGYQGANYKAYTNYAMAVRPGDVPAISEPQTYALMLTGLAALALARRRRSR